MKDYSRLLKKIIFTVALLSCSALSAADNKDTNHTFFAARPHGMNLAMEQPAWQRRDNNDTTFGGALQVSGFYSQTTNGKDLGKFFTFDGKEALKVQRHAGNFFAAADDADVHPWNFNLRSAYHGDISFSPEQESYGARLDYHQDLDNFVKGLYFAVSAPVVHVSNNPNLKEVITANPNARAGHNGPITVQEALKGHRFSDDWSENIRYGKVDGNREVTGLADIDVRLGYNFFEQKNITAGVEIAGTFPTTNAPTAEYMFEPTLGNRGHWAAGAGAHLIARMWQNSKVKGNGVTLAVHANYRYHFKDTEKRTLELKNKKMVTVCSYETN